jgi:hypothetical protein
MKKTSNAGLKFLKDNFGLRKFEINNFVFLKTNSQRVYFCTKSGKDMNNFPEEEFEKLVDEELFELKGLEIKSKNGIIKISEESHLNNGNNGSNENNETDIVPISQEVNINNSENKIDISNKNSNNIDLFSTEHFGSFTYKNNISYSHEMVNNKYLYII